MGSVDLETLNSHEIITAWWILNAIKQRSVQSQDQPPEMCHDKAKKIVDVCYDKVKTGEWQEYSSIDEYLRYTVLL